MRRFVVGDIHGCGKALRTVIETIDPQPDDELVFLGDYIDRGPDSRDVVDQVLAIKERCSVVALRGNHEIMLMGVAMRGLDPDPWLRSGGQATVTSYGGSLRKIPSRHLAFFQGLKSYYETSDSIFVHAGYRHDQDISEQDDAATFWEHLSEPPPPHKSGKRVYVGHTPQGGGSILDVGHLVCLDTYCFGGGYLTALDIDSQEVIQANLHGHLRRTPISALLNRVERIREGILRWRLAHRPEVEVAAEPETPPVSRPTISPATDQPGS